VGRKKTKAELAMELRLVRSARLSEGIVSVFNNFIPWSAIVILGWFAYKSVEVLAGKTTLADIGVNVLANVNISVAIAWTASFLGTGYGIRQRKLRKDTVERLQQRIQFLEGAIDPKRTSSTLTPRGDTRPEDKI
jgi:hypothetical protein